MSKEPINEYGKTSSPDFYLDEEQRKALTNMIGDFKGSVGIAHIGSGYLKVFFYDAEGQVIEDQMLWGQYGDAVMPTFRHWD